MRAARQAGKNPDSTPVSSETNSEMPTISGDIVRGHDFLDEQGQPATR